MIEKTIENPRKIVNPTPTTISFSFVLATLNKDYWVKTGKSIRHISLTLSIILLISFPNTGHAFCFDEAGEIYGVSPRLLWAIAKIESDFNPNAINRNRNGSYDVGLMQINSWWAKRLGNDLWKLVMQPCQNVKVGAWVLAQCIQRFGNTWKGIGCYNATSNAKRRVYAKKVNSILEQLNRK